MESSNKSEDVIPGMGKDARTVDIGDGVKQAALPYAFHYLDPKALFAMAEVMAYGAEKYGPPESNWRKIPLEDHLNHMIAHAFAWLAGDRSDNHLAHMACRAMGALQAHLTEPSDDICEVAVDDSHQRLVAIVQDVERQMSEMRDNNFFVPKLQLCPVCGKRLSWKKFADSNNGVDEFVCDAGHGKCLVTANNPPQWVGIEPPFHRIKPDPTFRQRLRSDLMEMFPRYPGEQGPFCTECPGPVELERILQIRKNGGPRRSLMCPQCKKTTDVV